MVNLIDRLTAGPPLGDQTTTLNPSRSPRPWLDLTYQLLQVGFALVPVALALYLLSANGKSAVRRIGLEFTRPWRDLAVGVGLAAAIGIPGLGLYAIARTLGLAVEVQASALNAAWWTIPVLLLAALQNALLEEVIVVGYLMERLRELRWSAPAIVITSALVRGSYHLYQGLGRVRRQRDHGPAVRRVLPAQAAGDAARDGAHAHGHVRVRRLRADPRRVDRGAGLELSLDGPPRGCPSSSDRAASSRTR